MTLPNPNRPIVYAAAAVNNIAAVLPVLGAKKPEISPNAAVDAVNALKTINKTVI